MKKNILLVVAIAVVGTAIFAFNSLRAQDQPAPPPSAPPVGQNPALQGNRPPPRFQGRPPGMGYRQAVIFLKRSKADLERATDDYGGHRQTAIDACDKAIQELEAVETSIRATEAAKRQQQQQNQSTNTPAPAPQQ